MNKRTSPTQTSTTRADIYAVGALVLLTAVVFIDLVLRRDDTVVSFWAADGSQYFSRMRRFGFEELARGNLPLWNPHIFSGTPFVGGFQSAMFYPLNLIYLALPLALAMNLDFTLHILLIGLFTYAWMRNRDLQPVSSLFGAAVFAFGGTVFLRVLAGHITMLAAITWMPLLLLAVDQVLKRPTLGWTLVGIFATTMQIMAGHPQTLYMTALLVGVYTLIQLAHSDQPVKRVPALATIAILPIFLGAVQLWTGLQVSQEALRSGYTSTDFATTYSFPPENLITLFAPGFFGNLVDVAYWGRWAFWDSAVYMGIAGLGLAVYGAFYGSSTYRRYWILLLAVFLVLALGRYTPVYPWALKVLPGLSSLRAPSKFMVPCALLASLLAAMGCEALFRGPRGTRGFAGALVLVALLALIAAGWFWTTSATMAGYSPFEQMVRNRMDTHEAFPFEWPTLDTIQQAARFAVYSLVAGAVTAAIAAALFWLSPGRRWPVYALVALGLVEVVVFARLNRGTFELSQHERPRLERLYAREPGTYRVLDVAGVDNAKRNHAMDVRRYSIWGYDPVILKRYAEYVAFAAGRGRLDPVLVEQAMWGNDPMTYAVHELRNFTFTAEGIQENLDLFRILRTHFVVINPGKLGIPSSIWSVGPPFPRFLLFDRYQLCTGRDSVFAALANPAFQPADTIILESEPHPAPDPRDQEPGAGSKMRILDESTDHVTIEIELARAQLLLVTDAYSRGWQVDALPGSVQTSYELLPADYTLRCIPLTAGLHRFRMEYRPSAFRWGFWSSVLSGGVFVVLVLVWLARRPKSVSTPSAQEVAQPLQGGQAG